MAEPRLIELAQQGDPQAIAALMNQSLHPKGMTATVERLGDALEVRLEADRIPNRQALTAFVEKGIHNLGIESIRSIRILGQQTGAGFPAWMQELYLEVSPVDSLDILPETTPPPAEPELPDLSSPAAQFTEAQQFSSEGNPDNPPDSIVSDPWTVSAQTEVAADESIDRSFDNSPNHPLEDTPDAPLQDSLPDSTPNGILDDLFAASPSNPTTTEEMGFEAAATPLTSVDDLLAALEGDEGLGDQGARDESERYRASDDADSESAADAFDAFFGEESVGEEPDNGSTLPIDSTYSFEAFSIQTNDPTAIESLFGETQNSEFGETQNSDLAPSDSTDALADLFATDDSEDITQAPDFTEEIIFVEETVVFDLANDPSEAGTSEATPEAETGFDEAAMADLFAEDTADESLFMVASEPLDVDRLQFGVSESEALDANLVEPGLAETEPSSESIEFLDAMAAETEMPPEVTLQDQWLESAPPEEAVAGDLGLEGFAPEGFAAVSEEDVFAQEFPDSPELINFPADLFPEETPEAAASQFSEGPTEEPSAPDIPANFGADFSADFGETSNSGWDDRSDDNLDLSNWFDDQIEPGDPAAELSTAPSEDFLTREDFPDFGLSEENDPEAAANALFNDVPPEPTFTPEASLLEELASEQTSENATDEFAPMSFEAETVQPEISQQQLEAQIENLFAEEEDRVTEASFQNSWELQSDDVSDDSADTDEWRNSLNFSLEEPVYPETESSSDAAIDDVMMSEETSPPDLSFDDEVTIVQSDFTDEDSPDLARLTDMPDIELPDDQVSPSEDPFALGATDFDYTDFTPVDTPADDADAALANTVSLSEAMQNSFPAEAIEPDQPLGDFQETDGQDHLPEMAIGFQHSQTQEDYGDLATLEDPLLPEELTDEQLQELLGSQPDEFTANEFTANEFIANEFTADHSTLNDSAEYYALEQPFSDPFADSDLEPVSESSADVSAPDSERPQQEPLLDFLNRQFGLEDEIPTVEELPASLPEEASEQTLAETPEQMDDREVLSTTDPIFYLEEEPEPTKLPFDATPFADTSMIASIEVPASDDPDLALDLSDDWLQDDRTTTPADPAALPSDSAASSADYADYADSTERQEQSQEDLERQLASSDFVSPPGNAAYYSAEAATVPPDEIESHSASRPASRSSGLFTLILFSIVGFIAALLGFSLWSEISSPPEPQPAPAAPPAAPTAPAIPPTAPAAPPTQTAPTAAPPVDPATAPPPADPIAPAPEASPVPPPAPAAPPADVPAPPAAPASP